MHAMSWQRHFVLKCGLVSAALLLAVPGNAQAVTTIIEVSLPTNDLVYDHYSDTIYASVPSSAGLPRGNSITPINPHTGALGTSVFISSEPTILALADDGTRLYAASDSTNHVRPFDLTTQTAGTSFAIGTGEHRVDDMEVAPGHSHILAVSRRRLATSPRGAGMAIYSNGVALPNATSGLAINNKIEFGDDHTTLYGHVNEISSLNFNQFPIDVSATGGIGGAAYSPGFLLTSWGMDMEYDNGRMYFTNGQVLETTTPGPVGSFSARGHLEPDSDVDRIYFAQDGTLKVFSQSTFLSAGEIPISGISGGMGSLIRLGEDGVAFRTSGGQVFIVRSDLIPLATTYDVADTDRDGDVDTADITRMFQNFTGAVAAGGKTGYYGDVDGDFDVDTADITTGFQRFTGAGGSAVATQTVPEPSAGLLLVFGLLSLGLMKLKRRS